MRVAAIVSLKASIEAWDQVDALLRRSFETYARTLEDLERHISRPSVDRFGVAGLDFKSKSAKIRAAGETPTTQIPTLERIGQDVEAELLAFGQRLCLNACSTQDLRDVAEALNSAISGIQDVSGKQETGMRTAAKRLRTASESDNVTALRILVRYQSAELTRLADEAKRDSLQLTEALANRVSDLTAGLKIAREEARQDSLTGMLNRLALKELMDEYLHKETPRCLILLDLDRFKLINDKFGYLAGDELLRQVAARIRGSLPANCAAARWGGDEFIVLVDGSISVGMSLAQHLDRNLRHRYDLGADRLASVFAQASVGLSEWKRGETADAVIQRADLALKSKKRQSESERLAASQ